MRHALEALKMYSSRVREEEKSIATLKINGNKKASIFSTHPSLDERIHRLS